MLDAPDVQVKFHRKKAELSRAELSLLTGIDINELVAIEEGTGWITMEQVIKIAQACKTSADEIFGMSPYPEREDLFK